MATMAERSLVKWQGILEASLADARKRAGPLAGWREELAGLEGQIPALEAQRVNFLSDGQDKDAEKVAATLGKNRQRADDLRLMIARRELEVKTALERIAEVERVEVARNTWLAHAAEEKAAWAELNEAIRKYVQPLQVRLSKAELNAGTSASYEADALKTRVPWVAEQMAALCGVPLPAEAEPLITQSYNYDPRAPLPIKTEGLVGMASGNGRSRNGAHRAAPAIADDLLGEEQPDGTITRAPEL